MDDTVELSSGDELANVAVVAPETALEQFAKFSAAGNTEELEKLMREDPRGIDFPLVHRFTKTVVNGESRGMYVREIFMPARTYALSKIHKTQHPYVVLSGRASVWTADKGMVEITAPYVGITEPGTERFLYMHEDTVWLTFHPTNETDLEKIEDEVIAKRGEFIPLAPVEAVALEVPV
jgi:hypothetical protein